MLIIAVSAVSCLATTLAKSKIKGKALKGISNEVGGRENEQHDEVSIID